MKRFILCLPLLISACGHSNDYDVDANFSAEESQDILTARTDWEIAIKEPINLTFGAHVSGDVLSTTNRIVKATSNDYNSYTGNKHDDIGFTTTSFTGGIMIVLVVDRIAKQVLPCKLGEPCDTYSREFRTTVRHELGHALGAKHTETRGSIMFARDEGIQPECIDSESAASWCEHNDMCKPYELRGCSIPNQESASDRLIAVPVGR